MKVCVLSDLHGCLPVLDSCDLVLICGDTVPTTEIQRNSDDSKKWFKTEFAEWVRVLPCKKVVFIAGNHDYWLERMGVEKFEQFIFDCGLSDKWIYLKDSSYIYDGFHIYGTPWCTGPVGWAFIDPSGSHYNDIPDCDILLVHQPPHFCNIGVSLEYSNIPNFGSIELTEAIKKRKNVNYVFCGHIHSGDHKENIMHLDNGKECKMYNVSIKDERYIPAYPPLYLNI